MARSHRFNALSFAIAALAPTWAIWRMADDVPAAAPVEPAEAAAQVANDTATAAAADAAADTAEATQAASDEAPATVSIDVPAQHQSLLERAAALLEKADSWIVDNIEAGIAHFEGLFKQEADAAASTDEAKDA